MPPGPPIEVGTAGPRRAGWRRIDHALPGRPPDRARATSGCVDQDGGEIDPGRETIALCRCGKSGIKPFCDGSHKRAGFSAPSAPSRPRPVQTIRELLRPGTEDDTRG